MSLSRVSTGSRDQGDVVTITRTETHDCEMLGWLDANRPSPINCGYNNRYKIPKKVALAKRKAAKKSKKANRRK